MLFYAPRLAAYRRRASSEFGRVDGRIGSVTKRLTPSLICYLLLATTTLALKFLSLEISCKV